MKQIAVVIGVILLFAFLMWLILVGGAVFIGITGAMFYNSGWVDGYHAAWTHPWRLVLYVFIIAPIFGMGRSSRS